MSRAPTLTEVIASAIDSRLLDVHTALPGRVMSYDPATQRCDVLPVVRRAIDNVRNETVHEDLPIIPNVPVGWPRGGGYGLQLPLAKGDHVWLVFSESATSHWRVSGSVSNPGDLRRFDLSYPVALPCVAPDEENLPEATGPLLSTPEGGGKWTVGSEAGASPVALAEKVAQQLTALKNAISSAAVTGGDGGAAFKANLMSALSDWPGDIASETLEAE